MNQQIKEAVMNMAQHIHEGRYAGIVLSGSTNDIPRALLLLSENNGIFY